MALGDSFTAGPGTGLLWPPDEECLRGEGSYAQQVYNYFPFEQKAFYFEACTGFTTSDVITRSRLASLPDVDFMVMTLGGNDIDFATITKYCIFRRARQFSTDCTEALDYFDRVIESGELENRMHEVYDLVFTNMANDNQHQLYHILYPTFFGTETTEKYGQDLGTEWCDSRSVVYVGGTLLTMKYREYFNDLTHRLNDYLQQIAYNYIQNVMPAKGLYGQLITIDPNNFYNGVDDVDLFKWHRICNRDEYGRPWLWTDNEYFFVLTDDSPVQAEAASPTSNKTVAEGAKNGTQLAKLSSMGNVTNGLMVEMPEWLKKTFHPKTVGFSQIAGALVTELRRKRPWNNNLRGNVSTS